MPTVSEVSPLMPSHAQRHSRCHRLQPLARHTVAATDMQLLQLRAAARQRLQRRFRHASAAADVQLLFDVGADLANSDVWPAWSEGDEFEAVRQASASSRR